MLIEALFLTVQWAQHPIFSPWIRHTIDPGTEEMRGADGVRLADVNGDGLLDLVTPWEETGVIKIYLHPGYERSKESWPQLTVGNVGSPEDAVFADLDGDGAIDVISSSEGETQALWIHWAPKQETDYLSASSWTTEALPLAQNQQQWMFALPMDIDGKHGLDIVAGGKNENAQIGWFQAPKNPRDLSAWQWHPLYDATWVMSLSAADLDQDGDLDIVASDRLGEHRGCLWFENPGVSQVTEPWRIHRIGDPASYGDREVMFLDIADLDQDGLLDIIVATRGQELIYFRQISASLDQWEQTIINLPDYMGEAKSVRVADLNLDRKLDLVVSSENANNKYAVIWLSNVVELIPPNSAYKTYNISDLEGIKLDLVQLIDIDGDGDLDVLTSEETTNLGVVWYENPIINYWN